MVLNFPQFVHTVLSPLQIPIMPKISENRTPPMQNIGGNIPIQSKNNHNGIPRRHKQPPIALWLFLSDVVKSLFDAKGRQCRSVECYFRAKLFGRWRLGSFLFCLVLWTLLPSPAQCTVGLRDTVHGGSRHYNALTAMWALCDLSRIGLIGLNTLFALRTFEFKAH